MILYEYCRGVVVTASADGPVESEQDENSMIAAMIKGQIMGLQLIGFMRIQA